MSPILEAALDERIEDDKTGRWSAAAVTEARACIRAMGKERNINDPRKEAERWALRVLCGVRLLNVTGSEA